MKKGISFWSFVDGTTVETGVKYAKDAGFEGVELLLVDSGIWGMAEGKTAKDARKIVEEAGLEVANLTLGPGWWSGLLTGKEKETREIAKTNIRRLVDHAVDLGIDSVLTLPGAVALDWLPVKKELLPYDEAYDVALEAYKELAPYAEGAKVTLAIENIWNKFLLSPLEMRDFIDKVGSDYVKCFFDVGNAMLLGFPEQWIKILGSRIKKIHVKDYRREPGDINSFCDLLAGDVDWLAVVQALEGVGYDDYMIAEMSPVYKQYPDQLAFNTAASMERILKKV